MSNRLIVHGMMTSQNFGDVLLAQVVTRWLSELTSAEILTAQAGADVGAILGLRNAKPADYLTANGVVLSGGGYFQMMDRGWPALRRFIKNVGPLVTGRLLGKPIGLVGVGVEQLPHQTMRVLLRGLLNSATVTGLRDPNSIACASSLGLRRAPTLTSDLVFTLTSDDLAPADLAVARQLTVDLGWERVVGLHLSEPSNGSSDYARLHESLRRRIAETPETVGFVLIEDHPNHNGGGQRGAWDEIAALLPPSRYRLVPYAGTGAMLALLHTLDAVFTNKLHVGLAAAAMGTMPFSLAKNRKNIASFATLGLADNCRMLSASDAEMDEILGRALTHHGHFEVPSEIRTLAWKNLDLLSAFVAAALPPQFREAR